MRYRLPTCADNVFLLFSCVQSSFRCLTPCGRQQKDPEACRAIEFYDFYAYGTAAANYFPKVFFGDTTNPTVALLASLLTFAIAFIARPLGSLVFGHFGDRMGRKTTLVVSLLTMGIATFLIGCLPTYSQVAMVGTNAAPTMAARL